MGCATSSIRNGEPESTVLPEGLIVVSETVPLLEVADLTVEFSTRHGVVPQGRKGCCTPRRFAR